MKRFYVGAVLAGLALAIWECKGDPTSSLRGGPATLSVVPRQIYIDTGKSAALVVTARDAQLNPVPVVVTVTSSSPTVAAVTNDTTRPFIDSSTYAFVVASGNLGTSKLTITGGGLTDSAIAIVLPVAFKGAISDTLPPGGSTITIRATSTIKFDTAAATVLFGSDNVPGKIVVATSESLRVITPFSQSGPLTISGLIASPGLVITRPSFKVVKQTGDFWAGDSSWQTAPDITTLLPASGKSSYMISTTVKTNNKTVCPEFVGAPPAVASSGPCMMFKFTLASPTTLKFTTDWEGTASNPDIDIYACSDSTVANFGTACFEEGGLGASAKKPESTGNYTYPAGTHYFVIENYAGGPSKNLRTTIARP